MVEQTVVEKRRWPLAFADMVAHVLVSRLELACHRIQVAGSVRRRKPTVGNIELVQIPIQTPIKNVLGEVTGHIDALDQEVKRLVAEGILDYRRRQDGSLVGYGEENKFMVHIASGMPVDLFAASEATWAMRLVVRTGPKELNVRLFAAARLRGMKGHAYGDHFTMPDGTRLVCRTESEVFAAVGWPYLPPEART